MRKRPHKHEHRDRWLWLIGAVLLAGMRPRAPVAPAVYVPQPTPGPSPSPGGGRLTLAQIRDLAAAVGFPDPDVAAAVAMAESSGNPLAVGDNGTSFGLWQVNVTAHPEYHATQLGDPVYNAQAALAIRKTALGWHHWTTYNTGAYLKYMGASA